MMHQLDQLAADMSLLQTSGSLALSVNGQQGHAAAHAEDAGTIKAAQRQKQEVCAFRGRHCERACRAGCSPATCRGSGSCARVSTWPKWLNCTHLRV